MIAADRRESPQERTGRGINQAMQQAFQPDQAAEDVLSRLIEQIDQLPWPRTTAKD